MDTLTNVFDSLTPGIKGLLTAIIGVIALFMIVKAGAKSMSAFSDKNISEGMIYLGLALLIIVVSVILFVGIWGLATQAGNDLNNELGYIMPLVTAHLN